MTVCKAGSVFSNRVYSASYSSGYSDTDTITAL